MAEANQLVVAGAVEALYDLVPTDSGKREQQQQLFTKTCLPRSDLESSDQLIFSVIKANKHFNWWNYLSSLFVCNCFC